MSTRTLIGMAASVVRAIGPSASMVPLGEVYQALWNANKQVNGRYEWPWLYTSFKVDLHGTYNTGTIDVTSGSTAVTGTGTAWDTTWTLRRLGIGNRNADYPIAAVTSPTTLTLGETPSLSSITDGGYVIYQDTYDLPLNYEPGGDIVLVNPLLRMELRKIPRQSLEQQGVVVKQLFTSIQTAYADAGYNDVTKRYQIKVIPPPAQDSELRLFYRRSAPDLEAATDVTIIPESYSQCLEFYAETEIRRRYMKGLGAMESEARAVQLLNAMKRRIDRQPIVNRPQDHGAGMPDSSFSYGGMSILPGWNA